MWKISNLGPTCGKNIFLIKSGKRRFRKNILPTTLLYLHYQDHVLNRILTHLQHREDLRPPNSIGGQNIRRGFWVKYEANINLGQKVDNIDFGSKMWKASIVGQKTGNIDFGLKIWKALILGQKCGKHWFWVKNMNKNTYFGSKMWKTSIFGQK